jgi:GMP reductase
VSKLLYYDDIALEAVYFDGDSRSELDTSVKFGPRTFKVPVMPANMKCSIDFELASWLSQNDYFYSLHRFYDYSEVKKWINNNQHLNTISISLGVQSQDYEFIEWYKHNVSVRIDYITIDIAHGHCKSMKEMIYQVKDHIDKDRRPYIIAGNVMTNHAVGQLHAWGADAVKVGIGQGRVCSTKLKTGFTKPMFSCVTECASLRHIPIIADGGVRHNGDIAKAIVAGADMVMAGGIFVKCEDSPAESVCEESIDKDGNFYDKVVKKRYYGSASFENKGHNKNVEGFTMEVDCNNMTYEQKLTEIQQDLQSSISYAGGQSVEDLAYAKYYVLNG